MNRIAGKVSLIFIFLVPLASHYSQSLEGGFLEKLQTGRVSEASLVSDRVSISTAWMEETGRVIGGSLDKSPELKRNQGTDEVQQFVAGGHVLGFRKGDMFIASAEHALRIEFVGGRSVSPVNEGIPANTGSGRQTAVPLGEVSYTDLWPGVTLVYERHDSGVVKSTYTVQPASADHPRPVDQIRHRYNVPVAVDESGNLILSFETGHKGASHVIPLL
jgi:hypothetical protein